MAGIIGIIIVLLCIVVGSVILVNSMANKQKIKRNELLLLKKQEEVENRIRKIEDVYGEKATVIMFQEFNVPDICELLVILEEARIILILGEAYNFSEILNLKIGQLNYMQLKHTAISTSPTHILEQAAAGLYSANTIKEVINQLEEAQELITGSFPDEVVKIDVMTSRLESPIISISPSFHTVDEMIVALSMVIDRNENRMSVDEAAQYKISIL